MLDHLDARNSRLQVDTNWNWLCGRRQGCLARSLQLSGSARSIRKTRRPNTSAVLFSKLIQFDSRQFFDHCGRITKLVKGNFWHHCFPNDVVKQKSQPFRTGFESLLYDRVISQYDDETHQQQPSLSRATPSQRVRVSPE